MKTVQYYLDRLDKTRDSYCYIPDLANEVGISCCDFFEIPELKCYLSGLFWVCTDTVVGLRFYFLNDELVAASFQLARKSDEEFEWVSREALLKTRQIILDRMAEQGFVSTFKKLDLDEDLTDFAKKHNL